MYQRQRNRLPIDYVSLIDASSRCFRAARTRITLQSSYDLSKLLPCVLDQCRTEVEADQRGFDIYGGILVYTTSF